MFNLDARSNYSKNAIKYISKELPENKLSTLWSKYFQMIVYIFQNLF